MIKFAMSLLILGLILAITLCGCGGGNGGNGKQDGPKVGLNGVYYMAELNINSGGESSSISEIIFDGNGNFTFEQIYGDKDGGNQNQSGSGAYEVKVDGSCTFTIDGEVTDARLSSDSRTFVAARINSKSVHNVSVGVKAGTGGFSKASLNGVYYMSGLNINSGGESSAITKITFDGNKNFTYEQINSESAEPQTGSGTYEVDADGTFTITEGDKVTDGRLSTDSRTFVAARTNSTSVHNVSVGVKH